jgi:ribosome maturation factor RimP
VTGTIERRITGMIGPAIEAMGYTVVRVAMSATRRPTLQIMAERVDGKGMTVDDCAQISRAVSAVLDVEDPIDSEYNLEVSSPGIDRPLTRLADFERFQGFDARVEMAEAVDGRKRFKGRLAGIGGADQVLIDMDGTQVALPFDAIRTAKLVLTDELLAAAGAQA